MGLLAHLQSMMVEWIARATSSTLLKQLGLMERATPAAQQLLTPTQRMAHTTASVTALYKTAGARTLAVQASTNVMLPNPNTSSIWRKRKVEATVGEGFCKRTTENSARHMNKRTMAMDPHMLIMRAAAEPLGKSWTFSDAGDVIGVIDDLATWRIRISLRHREG